MPKSKNNSLKLDTPPAIARKNAKVLIALLGVVILGALIVVGQQGEPMKKDISVRDRFESTIKTKEPNFRLVSKHVTKNQQENSVLQGWKADEEVVSVTTYEFASVAEAAEQLRKYLDAPISVPVQTIELKQLGDEAYMHSSNHGKEGPTYLLFRKGNFLIIMSGSTPGVAQRFATHIANEIDN